MRGDRAQLGLLLSNLLDNALRYTPAKGTVCVRLDATESRAMLQVADTGEGIPARELSRVFERFYRVDKARARQTGGTGLGLAIVRHVAEAHGGTVRVDSELGRGSTFTVSLPVTGPPAT
jgi:two-component system sensor histidine kinase BaeS